MKPSWDDAPPWAQWLAMDENGSWYWYEHKPYYEVGMHEWFIGDGRYELACQPTYENWKKALQERPND